MRHQAAFTSCTTGEALILARTREEGESSMSLSSVIVPLRLLAYHVCCTCARESTSGADNGTNHANGDTSTKFGTNVLWGLLVKSARGAT